MTTTSDAPTTGLSSLAGVPVGTRLRVLTYHPAAAPFHAGELVTYDGRSNTDSSHVGVTVIDGESYAELRAVESGSDGIGRWWVRPEHVVLADPDPAPELDGPAAEPASPAPADPEAEAVESRVSELLGDVLEAYGAGGRTMAEPVVAGQLRELVREARILATRLGDAERRASGAERRGSLAVRAIGRALAEAADAHSWCSEYEDRVSAVVAELPTGLADDFAETATREREYDVDVPLTVSVSVRVTARSAEDAEESAAELWQDYASGLRLCRDVYAELDPDRSMTAEPA